MNASALADLRTENARLIEQNDTLIEERALMVAAVETAHLRVDEAVEINIRLAAELLSWSLRAKTAEAALKGRRCEFPSCESPAETAMCSVHRNVRVLGSFVNDRHGSAS